jgi:hypothetical protein
MDVYDATAPEYKTLKVIREVIFLCGEEYSDIGYRKRLLWVIK